MRISNIEWLKKRIGFIRKLGEQTARQRQIIDLIDNEAGLTEQERKLLHVLATAEKNDLQAQESERKQAVQKRIEGKKQRRERNHRLFLAAGLLIEAGLVDTKTGELCYKKDRILQALKELKYRSGDIPKPRRVSASIRVPIPWCFLAHSLATLGHETAASTTTTITRKAAPLQG
ncbi:conjugal transfer protein TraD (plasmid) [Escherichia coli]